MNNLEGYRKVLPDEKIESADRYTNRNSGLYSYLVHGEMKYKSPNQLGNTFDYWTLRPAEPENTETVKTKQVTFRKLKENEEIKLGDLYSNDNGETMHRFTPKGNYLIHPGLFMGTSFWRVMTIG